VRVLINSVSFLVEAYAFIKEDKRIIENLERLRARLMLINFETDRLKNSLAMSYDPPAKAQMIDQFTQQVTNGLPWALDCISFVQQRLKELHGIEHPYAEGPI
jgi:hypothetical protein